MHTCHVFLLNRFFQIPAMQHDLKGLKRLPLCPLSQMVINTGTAAVRADEIVAGSYYENNRQMSFLSRYAENTAYNLKMPHGKVRKECYILIIYVRLDSQMNSCVSVYKFKEVCCVYFSTVIVD